jgi:hypothetical protein
MASPEFQEQAANVKSVTIVRQHPNPGPVAANAHLYTDDRRWPGRPDAA